MHTSHRPLQARRHFALAALLATLLVACPATASAQPPPLPQGPLLKRLYGFDAADPPAGVAQAGPVAAAPDGSVVNLMLAESAGPSRLRRFGADGRLMAAWAGTGGQEGRFERPQDVAVTTANEVWVLDLHRLHRFAPDGTLLDTLPWPPRAPATEGAAATDGSGGRLAAGPDGGLALAMPDGRIWLLGPDGRVIEGWSSPAEEENGTLGPSDLAILPDGSVAVVHVGSPTLPRGQSQLRRFSPGGRLLAQRRFGPLADEAYLYLDRVTAAPDGSLLVFGEGQVQRRDGEGRLLSAWPSEETFSGRDIAAAPDGTVYLQKGFDLAGSGCLQHVGMDGRPLGAVGDRAPAYLPDSQPALGAMPAPDGRLFTFRSLLTTTRLRWLTPLGQPTGQALEWPIGNDDEPFAACPRGPCDNIAEVNADGSLWATDFARGRLLHLAADGRVLAAASPLDAQGRQVFFAASPLRQTIVVTADGGLLLAGRDGRSLYRYGADLGLRGSSVPQQADATYRAVAVLDDKGSAALVFRQVSTEAPQAAVELSDPSGNFLASFAVPGRTEGLLQAPDRSLWLFPSAPEGIRRYNLLGEPLPPVRVELDASRRPRHPEGILSAGRFGPDGRLYTQSEVYGFDDLPSWQVRSFKDPRFTALPLSISSRPTLRCSEGCRDPGATDQTPGASLIAERTLSMAADQELLVHARGDLRLWVDERLVLDQRHLAEAVIDRSILLPVGRHRLEVEFSATDARAELAIGLGAGGLSYRRYLPALAAGVRP